MSQQQLVDREVIAARIVKFAKRNNLHIHPGQVAFKWADLVIQKGGCPCVPGRNSCPCAFALEDIKQLGRCRCGLFCNDAYLNNYNSLTAGEKTKKVRNPILGRAKGEFLKKLSINGFSISESGDTLTLSPRGAESSASITIQETEPNVWKVVSASGEYTAFARGKKRSYFESYLTRWAIESVLVTGERPSLPL